MIIDACGDLSAFGSSFVTLLDTLFIGIDTFERICHLFLALCTIDLLCGFLTRTHRSLVLFLLLFLFYIFLFDLLVIFLFQLFSNRLCLVNDVKIWADKIIYCQLVNVFLLSRLCGHVIFIVVLGLLISDTIIFIVINICKFLLFQLLLFGSDTFTRVQSLVDTVKFNILDQLWIAHVILGDMELYCIYMSRSFLLYS